MSNQKQYAERDIMQLDEDGGYYFRHVDAMTGESLHSKSDIAAELGHRDQLIDTYRELCGELLDALKNSSAAAHMHTANLVCCGKVGQQCCGEPDVDWPAWAKQLMDDNHGFITKAEAILGENNGTSN